MPGPATQTLTKDGLMDSAASLAAMENAMQGFTRTTLADLLTQQEKLMTEHSEVTKNTDAANAAARLEIINADMAALEKKISEYRDDTAELIAGLEAQFEKLGLDLSALQKPTAEDLKIQQGAEAFLKDLVEVSGPAARALLVDAITTEQGSWNPIGKGDRIRDAETALERFDAQHTIDIAAARTAVGEAKAEVERLRRKRIRDAEFDAQFDRFIGLAKQIQGKLLENVKSSEVRMQDTQKALGDALTKKEDLAGKLKSIDVKIRAAEDVVLSLETEKSNAVDETARSTVDTKLGTATQTLADLNGEKQEMQVSFNALEAAADKHQKMLSSLQVQRDNQRSHAVKLSIDAKARFTQAQNLVRIIQNTAQEDAASRLHSAGSTLDRTSLEIAARALIASERERINMLTRHEADMKAFGETGAFLAEGRAQVAIQDAEIAARMKKNYGIDPLGGSWLHIASHMGDAPQAPATP